VVVTCEGMSSQHKQKKEAVTSRVSVLPCSFGIQVTMKFCQVNSAQITFFTEVYLMDLKMYVSNKN
jgi:hypothetical protein